MFYNVLGGSNTYMVKVRVFQRNLLHSRRFLKFLFGCKGI